MKRALLSLSLVVVGGCTGAATHRSNGEANDWQAGPQQGRGVIYGDDNRLDKYAVTDPQIRTVMDSTVAIMESTSLRQNASGDYDIFSDPFGPTYGLCTNEPFYNQGVAAFCSGFLVSPDIVVTAGHCITTQSTCSSTKIVFGFAIEQPNGTAQVALRDNVYSCRELIHAQAPSNGADFGVIRLDRPVTNHVPLRLRQSGAIRAGDGIFVVGHPAGLPQKLADGATVRSVNTDYFVANLDTYGGNSGSAVFNAVTREVEGILVRGETDFVSSGSCQVSNRCSSSGCRGEDVTRIDQVLSFLPSPTQPPPPPEPSEFSATPNLSIPDRNMTGVSSQIQVTRTTAAQQIQVKVNIRHTYRGDLKIVLVAPDGTNVVLKNANSSDGQDDVAGTYGDTLTSVDPLARLSNRSVGGIWTLKVADTFRFDRGTLVSWSVRFL